MGSSTADASRPDADEVSVRELRALVGELRLRADAGMGVAALQEAAARLRAAKHLWGA